MEKLDIAAVLRVDNRCDLLQNRQSNKQTDKQTRKKKQNKINERRILTNQITEILVSLLFISIVVICIHHQIFNLHNNKRYNFENNNNSTI